MPGIASSPPVAFAAPDAFRWDATARRFRSASGSFVARSEVRSALDAALDAASAEARSLAEKLAAGSIDRASWLASMRKLTKDAIVASGTVAAGGRASVTPRLMGGFGARVKAQYGYLEGLSREIEGGLTLDGNFLARCSMYPLAGTGAYEATLRAGDVEAGFTEERRILHSPAPCGGCVAEAAKGWREAGTLRPIGACECLTRCRCTWESRRPRAATMSAGPVEFAPPVLVHAPAVDFA